VHIDQTLFIFILTFFAHTFFLQTVRFKAAGNHASNFLLGLCELQTKCLVRALGKIVRGRTIQIVSKQSADLLQKMPILPKLKPLFVTVLVTW
jgi:hypothetical protein